MSSVFDSGDVFITVLGYDLSFLEFAGTVLNLLSVWLVIRRSILTWPVGIAAVILFAVLFYQIELYSDFVEQIYFVASGFYGWYVWSRMNGSASVAAPVVEVARLTMRQTVVTALIVVAGTAATTVLMINIHRLLPALFPEPASYPFLDAFTTVMSFVAQILMARKKLECWPLWIAVDVLGIGLYYRKGVEFIALLYVVFLLLAIRGLITWYGVYRSGAGTSTRSAISPAAVVP